MRDPFHSSAEFFEAKYQNNPDPWNFAHSPYERQRYAAILNALGGSYLSAFEPGCSVGVLTEGLAPYCDHLLAADFSQTAVQEARERCRRFRHVEIVCQGLQDVSSFATFDLVVLSEIGYYFSAHDWADMAERIVTEMPPEATLIAAHWTGRSTDHEIEGDVVHEILSMQPKLRLQLSERHIGFRLERWQRS